MAKLDPLSRAEFARAIDSLAEEFHGIFGRETIERYVDESISWLWRCEAIADVGEFGPHLLTRTTTNVCEK